MRDTELFELKAECLKKIANVANFCLPPCIRRLGTERDVV